MRRFLHALIVLHKTFGRFPIRARMHTLVRFLTCPFLRVVKYLPQNARVLDIGAGHGVFSRLALDAGASRVIAVEPDARKVFPIDGVDFVIGFDDVIRGSHDAIVINDVLYKIPISQWDTFLDRIAVRLADDGVLLVKEQDPTARLKNSWNAVQEWIATKAGLTLGQAFAYEPPPDFAARLRRHGFGSVEVKKIDGWYPHPHILYIARRT